MLDHPPSYEKLIHETNRIDITGKVSKNTLFFLIFFRSKDTGLKVHEISLKKVKYDPIITPFSNMILLE
jgi:hypothetical protein